MSKPLTKTHPVGDRLLNKSRGNLNFGRYIYIFYYPLSLAMHTYGNTHTHN